MALYPGLTLTDAGIQMIAESQLNETKLIITKAKIGDGDLPMGQDISKMTDVLSPKLEAPFSSFKNLGDGQIDIKFAVSNAEVKAGFFAKEIGIFATLEDGSETLYAYTNAGNKTDWVPDKSTPIDSQIIECQLKIGNAPNVIINISDKTYALAEDLANHESSGEAHKDLFDSIKIALNTKANDTEVTKVANELNEFKSANDYIVKSYSDKNGNWYRKFKSGWLEQGGVITVSKTSYNIPVNFLKPYANSNYALACNYTSSRSYASSTATTNTDTSTRISCITNRHSKTGFYLSHLIVDTKTKWYACGQGVKE